MQSESILSKKLKFDQEGFSLLELLVSVAVIVLLMALIFGFLDLNQRRYRSQQLLGEINQGGRSAFEVIAQELNQAGYNPPFQQNRQLSAAANASGSAIVSTSLQFPGGGTSGVTQGIFYGSRLVIGNSCSGTPTTCDQEEVLVNNDTSYGTTAITTTAVPVVLTNNHASGEPVFSRNYPFPSGIYYDNRTAGTALAVADNKLRFYGDILDTGDMYYGEYRLQCPGSTPGTYIDACATGCTQAPFVLTRFLTKLANSSGVFKIPASKSAALDGATVSPLVDNIQGTCPALPGTTAPADWLVDTALDETSSTGSTVVNAAIDYSGASPAYIRPVLNSDGTPAIWFKMNTYGAVDTSVTPNVPYFQTFVLDVRVVLTVQEAVTDPETGAKRVQRLQTHIVPRNINDALTIAQNGGSLFLPLTPFDPNTSNKLPLP